MKLVNYHGEICKLAHKFSNGVAVIIKPEGQRITVPTQSLAPLTNSERRQRGIPLVAPRKTYDAALVMRARAFDMHPQQFLNHLTAAEQVRQEANKTKTTNDQTKDL
jgi:hypothetical protein